MFYIQQGGSFLFLQKCRKTPKLGRLNSLTSEDVTLKLFADADVA